LDQIGHALGVSLFYQDILLTVKAVLEHTSPQEVSRKRVKRRFLERLTPEVECPACAYRATLEAIYIETLLDHLVDPEFVDRLRTADPLCLTHLVDAIEMTPDARSFRTLRDVQIKHWEQLIAELNEFARKNDHRFQHESVGKEGTAWLRAVDAIAGTCDLTQDETHL
jgi:hypothetical protein